MLHQVVFIRPAHQGEERAGGEPARPGQADLEVDQTRLASLVYEDVFTLVQVDVNDVALVHCVQQVAKRRVKRFVHGLSVAERMAFDVIAGHGIGEETAFRRDGTGERGQSLKIGKGAEQMDLVASHSPTQPAHRDSEYRSLPMQLDHFQTARWPFVKAGGRPGIVLERLAEPMTDAGDGEGIGQRSRCRVPSASWDELSPLNPREDRLETIASGHLSFGCEIGQ